MKCLESKDMFCLFWEEPQCVMGCCLCYYDVHKKSSLSIIVPVEKVLSRVVAQLRLQLLSCRV
ncbi:hypothetical protein H206_05401 [Candidatus Electrothrix aarhusensis]|uniref:Uncharacterized protein n=1 Tax=Candidatus Electrothrix aarhusensis TaxID=1859131 RepID=A0A3S3QLT4_9BACT|nr:hypothetical protein H206_05401 [Candidatus Electrothrix aarhusensis]